MKPTITTFLTFAAAITISITGCSSQAGSQASETGRGIGSVTSSLETDYADSVARGAVAADGALNIALAAKSGNEELATLEWSAASRVAHFTVHGKDGRVESTDIAADQSGVKGHNADLKAASDMLHSLWASKLSKTVIASPAGGVHTQDYPTCDSYYSCSGYQNGCWACTACVVVFADCSTGSSNACEWTPGIWDGVPCPSMPI